MFKIVWYITKASTTITPKKVCVAGGLYVYAFFLLGFISSWRNGITFYSSNREPKMGFLGPVYGFIFRRYYIHQIYFILQLGYFLMKVQRPSAKCWKQKVPWSKHAYSIPEYPYQERKPREDLPSRPLSSQTSSLALGLGWEIKRFLVNPCWQVKTASSSSPKFFRHYTIFRLKNTGNFERA